MKVVTRRSIPQFAAAVAALSFAPVAQSVTIIWDSTSDVSQLRPYDGRQNSLFPDLGNNNGNIIIISDGPRIDGRAYGAVSQDDDLSGNTITIKAGGEVFSGTRGAESVTGNVSNNQVIIEDGIARNDAIGGFSFSGDVTGNSTIVSGGMVGGFAIGGQSQGGGNVTGNSLTVSGSGSVRGALYGGHASGGGESSYNSVLVDGVDVPSINGGQTVASGLGQDLKANGNTVTLLNANSMYSIRGGFSGSAAPTSGAIGSITSNGNQVTLSNSTSTDPVSAGFSNAYASGTGTVTFAEVSSNDNVVIFNDSVGTTVNGGVSSVKPSAGFTYTNLGNVVADGNSVDIAGVSAVEDVTGGSAVGAQLVSGRYSSANNNMVTLRGDATASADIIGGEVETLIGLAVANNNTVMIADNASVGGNVVAGYATTHDLNASVTANDNEIIITGGTVSGNIYGGYAVVDVNDTTSTATGNTVTIHAAADVSQSMIYGGFADDGQFISAGVDVRSGNTLNLHGKGIAATRVNNFETYNFYLTNDVAAGDTLLVLSGSDTTDLTGTKVNIGSSGATAIIQEGEILVLIDALAGDIVGAPVQGSGMQGVTIVYDMELEVLNDQLIGTVARTGLAEQSKALSEAFLAGLALANQGADLLIDQGISGAVATAARGNGQAKAEATSNSSTAGQGEGNTSAGVADSLTSGWAGFYAIGGGHQRYATGSHVSMDSFSLIAGVAKGVDLAPGRLSVGMFFEYGYGSYDTYNNFSGTDFKGDGTSHYYGGGALAQMAFVPTGSGHFYAEASARGGAIDNSYGSSDFAGSPGVRASYDSTTAYYGMHVGGGYVWKPGDALFNGALKALSFDTNAKFIWTRQSGKDVTLSTGDAVSFSDADSLRLRLGSRANYQLNTMFSLYGGLLWEYEFDGDANGATGGFSIVAPTMRGGTGIGELGVSIKPFTEGRAANLTLGLGVQGYVGKREGVSGSGQIRYAF